MKYFNTVFLFFFTLVSVALGQSVVIGYPAPGKKVHRGHHLTVEIDQPNSIQGSWTVGVAIGIASCADPQSPCLPASQGLSTVLYNGPYYPKLHQPPPIKPRYQNFTVSIPSWMPKGPAQLNVAYAGLFGAAAFPYFQAINQTLIVV
ncbi:hypothetical protein AX15_006072 [Amanita polypyramis BW_CC]|nr:hypothetical protein AX15_006072 [Amanita polypyramis BW_CC]